MILKKTRDLRIAYHNVFESPEGKKVLADLRKRCPLLTDGINMGGGIDVHKLLVLEGQNNVLKYIYKMLGRDPNEDRPEEAMNRAIGE